ncbi:MAG: YraN family protein [Synechococcales cyanobacterium]
MTRPTPPRPKSWGDAGETWVRTWLESEGWQTVATQWRCRWGELDLVMYRDPVLALVEVKTRRTRSWDQQGALAILGPKQQRLIRAAQAFLQEYPQWQEAECRFDVALVGQDAQGSLVLGRYIEGAFDLGEGDRD